MASFSSESQNLVHHLTLLKHYKKMALEICHFASEVDPACHAQKIYNQLRGITAELQEQLPETRSDREKVEGLIHFFFGHLGFQISHSAPSSLRSLLLPEVLDNRQGPREVLALIFLTLAEAVNLKIELNSDSSSHLMKVFIDDHPTIIDFDRRGHFLEPYEIVDLVNHGIDFNHSPPPELPVILYLRLLKKMARDKNQFGILTKVQSHLIRHQPFNLKYLSERALIAYESGNFREAIEDIRDYFLYRSSDISNFKLKNVYRMARKKIKKLEQDHL